MSNQVGVRPTSPIPRLQTANQDRLQLALQRYQRVIAKWPTDKLRPNTQLQDLIRKNVDSKYGANATVAPNEAAELQQANALTALLDDTFKNKVRLTTPAVGRLNR